MKTWSTPARPQEAARAAPCALCGGAGFRKRLACEGFSWVECRACGLVQMNPRPGAAELGRRYGEDYGEDYLAYEMANEKAFLRLQELALEDAGFFALEEEVFREARRRGEDRPGVLDVGSATGALLDSLRGRGWEVTGVEISPPQAEYARRERKLDIRTLPLEQNRFGEGSFDAALASHLIEHLPDPALFAGELHRVLRPGGRVYITTPNIDGFQARLFRERWRSAIFDHLYLFSRKTLGDLLRRHGFVPERLVTWGGLGRGTAPAPIKKAADRLAKRLGFGDVMLLRAVKPRGITPQGGRP